MESDTFILEFNESSEDGGERVDIYCQDSQSENEEHEEHFEDSSSFPVLLIDSVCSLSEARDKTFEPAEFVKQEETLEEQLTSDGSHSSYLLHSQCEEDNAIMCEPETENATDGTQYLSVKQHVQPRFSFNVLPTAATSFTEAISQNSTSSHQHSTNVLPVVHDKLNVKYDNYRKKNNRATRHWRQKAKERQAEALEKNKRLHIQNDNLVNVIRKLRSSASSELECELNSKEEKDPLADGNPTNKQSRDKRKHAKLDEENDRLTGENNRLCQVIEDLMKKLKSGKKPAGTSSVTAL